MIRNQIKKMYLTVGENESMPCELPTTMYSVLLAAGKMSDPYHGINIESANDGTPRSCVFSSDVELTLAESGSKHVYLYVRRVSAVAEIYFNGRRFGSVASPDRVSIFDVADVAVEGKNILQIKCTSPLPERRVLDSDGAFSSELEMAPYLADMGLGEVEIVSTNEAVIRSVGVTQAHENGRVTLHVSLETLGDTENLRAMATLLSPSGKIYFGGITGGTGTVTVTDPELWWPNGLGSHLLYKLTVTLYRGEIAADSRKLLVGLRSVELVDKDGEVPYVRVNGNRLSSFGATYVVGNPIRNSHSDIEHVIRCAAESGMNTLRVVGEGKLPPEEFYELCDKYGLLVWQDVAVPYVKEGVAAAFAAGITSAVCDALSTATAHSSVALTYLSVLGTVGGIKPETEGELSDFSTAAANIIAPVAQKYGNGTAFIDKPYAFFAHDERYAASGEGYVPLPSVPELASLRAFAESEDINLSSPSVEVHTRCRGAIVNMLSTAYKSFRFPSGMQEMSYVSELSSAYEARSSVLRARKNKNAFTSAVCRQLNDVWPAVSAAGIDFFGRAKAISYLARSFFAPVAVIGETSGANVTFTVSNESRNPYTGKLIYSLWAESGECLREGRVDVGVPELASAEVAGENLSRYITEDLSNYYVMYELSDSRGISSSGVLLFTSPKRHAFSNPMLRTEIIGSGKRYTVKIMSGALALGVKVGFDGIDARFDRSFVDIAANVPVMLSFDTAVTTTVPELNSRLVINTVWGIGR